MAFEDPPPLVDPQFVNYQVPPPKPSKVPPRFRSPLRSLIAAAKRAADEGNVATICTTAEALFLTIAKRAPDGLGAERGTTTPTTPVTPSTPDVPLLPGQRAAKPWR